MPYYPQPFFMPEIQYSLTHIDAPVFDMGIIKDKVLNSSDKHAENVL